MSNDVMKFNYNSSHNNFPAIESLNPLDIGTEKQFMFTAKMLAAMFHVSHKTIDRRVETLIDTGDLSGTNLSLTKMPDSRGSLHEATVYDLTVLNKLAMTMIDNPIAVEVRKAFNDVIVKVETTGSYGVQLDEHDLLLLNISKAKTDTERALAVSKLDEYHERNKRALEDKTKELEAENEDLKNTNDELLTENELIRGNYFNTKQIYEILKRDYPEALQQAESTNYNKLRKGLCDITNEKRQGRKVYKKHVKNDKGETEWRQEYYFERNILDTILERVKESIRYIFNIRLR